VFSCKNNEEPAPLKAEIILPKIINKYGYVFNDYKVVEDTIKRGESFGEILDRNHVEYPRVYKIAESIKDSFDVRRLNAGKPYTILAKNDSTEKAQVFIYRPNKIEYVVIDFTDSIMAQHHKKEIQTRTKTESGVITEALSSLSLVIDKKGLDYIIVNEMSEIYAWTVDFFHLQRGDSFKIIYEEKFVDDTTYVGIGKVKAAYFEHKKTPFYAFNYVTDSTKNIYDFYDDKAGNLRKQFLKAPLKFGSRISSRYNLKRRIAHYGYRVKAHRGTDFPAAHGTPIITTANGTVVESRYKGGNGNYVKVKHNSTYSTQYLHMSKRKAKVGEFVKQGDVIGYVGNTGSSAGNHVCYRFWKHGRQVDPLRQKLPSAEPMKEELKDGYFKYITSFKDSLDNVIVK
jgi:murein DD-endopeptidase MepM/ murein hydrolase activator NlpD